eukprot:TRINITY_DN9158_c0_g1_i1.p1 TRINITY_DN9158_c0_g1~~TRINITY_DN9158_c0_g1_i1.p1  ORF type:complete len:686 (-),score=216.76 TRINITY_DN9158_c0_g1_i1:182-2239(-)
MLAEEPRSQTNCEHSNSPALRRNLFSLSRWSSNISSPDIIQALNQESKELALFSSASSASSPSSSRRPSPPSSNAPSTPSSPPLSPSPSAKKNYFGSIARRSNGIRKSESSIKILPMKNEDFLRTSLSSKQQSQLTHQQTIERFTNEAFFSSDFFKSGQEIETEEGLIVFESALNSKFNTAVTRNKTFEKLSQMSEWCGIPSRSPSSSELDFIAPDSKEDDLRAKSDGDVLESQTQKLFTQSLGGSRKIPSVIEPVKRKSRNGDRIPKCGTLDMIVRWLCLENKDTPTMVGFLLTSWNFGFTCFDIFDCLVRQYGIAITEKDETSGSWYQKRIVRFLNIWLNSLTAEELARSALKQPEMKEPFIQSLTEFKEVLDKAGFEYDRSIETIIQSGDFYFASVEASVEEQLMKPKILKTLLDSNSTITKFLKIPVEKLAAQMHSIEASIFKKIQPKLEFANTAWTKLETAPTECPNVIAMIEKFNQVSYWVATEILTCNDAKTQVKTIKRFIKLGQYCRKINSFNSMTAIIAGLNLHSVSSLVLQVTPQKYLNIVQGLEAFISSNSNYKIYRAELSRLNQMVMDGTYLQHHQFPVLPYLGVYLRDILFCNDNNPNFIIHHGKSLINFQKMFLLGHFLSDIQTQQLSSMIQTETKESDVSVATFLSNIQVLSEENLLILKAKSKILHGIK